MLNYTKIFALVTKNLIFNLKIVFKNRIDLKKLLVLKNILLASMVLSITACVPSEETTVSSIDKVYGHFAGADLVQTLSDTQVRVSWTDAGTSKVTGYNIYNVTIPSAPVLIKTVGAGATETTVTGLSRNILYRFRVRAFDSNNVEDTNTNDRHGIPFGGVSSVTVQSSTSALLNYHPIDAGEALEARAYCKTPSDTNYVLYSTILNMSSTSVLINGLVTNTSYTCKVNVVIDGLEDNNLQTVTFMALGSADHLVFVTQPGNAQAGEVLIQQPVVHVLDVNNNIVSGGPDATALITLEIATSSPTGGTVRGTYAINAVAGVATFTDINFQESGSKILTARKSDTSSFSFGTPEITVDSNSFNISPGNISPAFTTLEINPAIIPPFDALVANGVDAYEVKFTLRDAYGNPVPGVKPQFSSNILGDFNSQPLVTSDANGEVSGSISTTIADTNPARILSISSPSGLSSIQVAAPFKAGPPNRVAFFVQPANSPAGANGMNEVQVAVQDAQGNLITSGASASASITLSISNNVGGAILSGVNPKNAVNGIAIFSDLGIDKTGNGYKLIASSGALNPATSNNFNITAGIPKVISMTGPATVKSGVCSSAITLQLQDFGGNPAKAVQTTTVQLSGLGTSQIYSSGTCAGAPLGTNISFTPGTDTRTLYLKNSKSLSLNIVGTDASSVLVSSNYNIKVTPSKLRLVAEAAPPAPSGTLLTVTAGQCSSKIVVSPLAEDGSAGEVFSATNISINGISGSVAKLYSDSSCSNEIDPLSFAMSIGAVDTLVYLKDDKGENLTVNVADPASNMSTVSLPQDIKILASKIIYSGPASVVAGQCSTAFTITLRDVLNNNVPTIANTNLSVVGVQGVSATGKFYTSASCTGGGSNTTITIPSNSSSTTVYFKGLQAEILNIKITDPAGNMTDSATKQLTISPSDLRFTPPSAPVSSLTSECRGPFILETLDGSGTVAPVVANVQANLTGAGTAGQFYNDLGCLNTITSVTFVAGQSSKSIYFKGQYPEPSLTLTATDNAGVLNPATQAWSVIGDWGWLGTAATQYDSGGNLLPFRTGLKPVSARYDGIRGAQKIAFSPNKQFLFVADYDGHRIVKYDYSTMQYKGWTGRLRFENGIGSSGSNQTTPSSALCISTTNNSNLPGWCVGGRSINGEVATGSFYYPWGITSDDTYVYVTSYHGHVVSRFKVDTGEFDGWIGWVNSTSPTGAATGGPVGCSSMPTNSQTPGWCLNGNSKYHNTTYDGDGRMRYPRSVRVDNVYMYIGIDGAVLRYDKTTGSFQGWIGMVDVTPTGGAAGCTVAASDTVTPGWCMGGRYKTVNPRNHLGLAGGVNTADDMIISGTYLYVLNSNYGGVINRYDVSTGAFQQILPNLNFTWTNPNQMAFDGTNFYVADDERVLKVGTNGLIESWMGKVANNASMSGNPGCNTLQPNENTPGWCLGGSHKPGLDETSFLDNWGIALDGAGSFITISRRTPMLKKFSTTTGVYQGAIGLESRSVSEWSSDRTTPAEYHGFDDNSMYNPMGSLVVGNYLFVSELDNSRIKKFDLKTGQLVGWIGAITSKPTGGQVAGCLSANAMGPSPSWCKGASPYPTWTWNDPNLISQVTDGIMSGPYGLTSDGTWLYVTDYYLHRIQRFKVDDGSYGGWIGRISISPTGNAPGSSGCVGAAVNSFTPGWCLGGISKNGSADGELYNPTGIVYDGGNLYVIDTRNSRVSSYSAVTGAFNGWNGRVSSAPTSGCTYATNGNYNVVTSGWCKGGSSALANYRNDRGGGFNFDYSYNRAGIHSDGTYLYITNTRNIRIDQFNISGGFVKAFSTREDQYISVWESTPANVAAIGNGLNCSYPTSVWVDANYIYGTNGFSCSRDGDGLSVWKVNKTTGTIVGWKGGVSGTYPPTGGDPGCVGSVNYTPGWCQGGRVASGLLLGQFSDQRGTLFGGANYLYVTDPDANRITRVPK